MKPQGKIGKGGLPERISLKLRLRRLKKDSDAWIFLFPAYLLAFIFLWKNLIKVNLPENFWREFFAGKTVLWVAAAFFGLLWVSFMKASANSPWKKHRDRENWAESLPIGDFHLFRVSLFDLYSSEMFKFAVPLGFLYWATSGYAPGASQLLKSIGIWLLLGLSAHYLSSLKTPKVGRKAAAVAASLLSLWCSKDTRPIVKRDLTQLMRMKEPLFYPGLFFLTVLLLTVSFKYRTEPPPKWIWWGLGMLSGHFFAFTAHRVFSENLKHVWREFSLPVTPHGFWQSRVNTALASAIPASLLFFITGFSMKELLSWELIFHITWLPLGVAAICGALAFEGNKKHSSLNMMITFLAALGFGFLLILHSFAFLIVPVIIMQFHEKMEFRMKTVALDENPF